MKKIIHRLDNNTTRVKFVYPSRQKRIKRFTKEEKIEAKLKHEEFKNKHPQAWREGRDEIIKSLVTNTITPNYNLKVLLSA